MTKDEEIAKLASTCAGLLELLELQAKLSILETTSERLESCRETLTQVFLLREAWQEYPSLKQALEQKEKANG